VDDLFSAGDQVAFHARRSGTYGGGLTGLDAAVGSAACLPFSGIATVADGKITNARLIADRAGLARRLLDGPGSDGRTES